MLEVNQGLHYGNKKTSDVRKYEGPELGEIPSRFLKIKSRPNNGYHVKEQKNARPL